MEGVYNNFDQVYNIISISFINKYDIYNINFFFFVIK